MSIDTAKKNTPGQEAGAQVSLQGAGHSTREAVIETGVEVFPNPIHKGGQESMVK